MSFNYFTENDLSIQSKCSKSRCLSDLRWMMGRVGLLGQTVLAAQQLFLVSLSSLDQMLLTGSCLSEVAIRHRTILCVQYANIQRLLHSVADQ